MRKFDIVRMQAHEYDQRGKNVFYETPEFKLRVIDLAPRESLPQRKMASYVVFVCMEGEAEVGVGGEEMTVCRGQCLVTEPATVAMSTQGGARLLGIQIHGAGT